MQNHPKNAMSKRINEGCKMKAAKSGGWQTLKTVLLIQPDLGFLDKDWVNGIARAYSSIPKRIFISDI